MKELIATVKQNKLIAENIYAMTLTLPESVGEIRGGQFLNLSVGDKVHLLKRPLGICKVEGDDITVCYQLKGEGTNILSQKVQGDKLAVLLPLGNGFILPESVKNVAVIGGGVGVFPLISVIREHLGKVNFHSYIGFRNKQSVCLMEELEKSNTLTVTTDDGSVGVKGNAVSAYFADENKVKADLIIACGPPIMLKVLKQKLIEAGDNTPCLVSLEERMGCGIGACLVCVCKTTSGSNTRVCKDGPVFKIGEVEL
ncbi:MAG: dihydroorotate dehydrogenase electron transfer subunit [Clostridiales bacterium]|nr:dihydroorotate dehydrogenase electron transfer subunit [Clostridiales bacterium]